MKDKLINITLILLITVTAVAIFPSEEQYNILKIWALLICGAILLILMLANYKKLKLDKKDYIILGFAFWIFLSTMHSKNVLNSIIGEKNRWEGMLSLYTYIIIYMCAKKFANYKTKTLLRIWQILYMLICIWGIVQNYVSYPNNSLIPIFNKNVCGTFGNSNFMGNFTSIGLPIFIITYILDNDKFSLCTALVTFFCLLACNARSGWVAFFAFSIVLVVYLIKNFKREYIKRIIILIVAFVLIFGILYTGENSVLKMKINAAKRDLTIMSRSGIDNGGLGSGRIGIWKIVIDIIRQVSYFRSWNR